MKAFVKYVSYANMLHTLRYDETGNIRPDIDMGATTRNVHRLDDIVWAKAIKWGTRLQKYEKFMKSHALNTFLFVDPIKFPPYVGTYADGESQQETSEQKLALIKDPIKFPPHVGTYADGESQQETSEQIALMKDPEE